IFDSSSVNFNHSKTIEMGGPGKECSEGMIVKSQVVADVISYVVNYVCKTKMSCSKTIMKVKQGIISLSPQSRGKHVRFRNQDEEHQQEDDHKDEKSIKILKDESLAIPCPCRSCNNFRYKNRETMYNHLMRNGITRDYTTWNYHGKESDNDDDVPFYGSDGGGDDMSDEDLDEMLDNIGGYKTCDLSEAELMKIHTYILNNYPEMRELINEHKVELEEENFNHVNERHDKEFASWLQQREHGNMNASEIQNNEEMVNPSRQKLKQKRGEKGLPLVGNQEQRKINASGIQNNEETVNPSRQNLKQKRGEKEHKRIDDRVSQNNEGMVNLRHQNVKQKLGKNKAQLLLGRIRKLVFEIDDCAGRIVRDDSQTFITKGGCVV
nr:putative transposase-associated domain-containing protein [Tanacetum cinerariifolium]